MKQSQRLILTWLLENNALFSIVEKYISPADFTEAIYKKAAEILFGQLKEGNVNPGKIVSMFELEEEQREIAAIFNDGIHEVETKQEMQKAIKETIIRVKQNSIEARSKALDYADMKGLAELVLEKKQLQALEQLQIHFE